MIKEGNLTLGTLTGLPILIIIILLSVGVAIWGYRNVNNNDWDGLGWIVGVAGTVNSVIFVLILGIGFYPYSAQYHHYYKVTGVVTHIAVRQVSNGSGFEQRYVVTIQGLPEPFAVDDTRAALLRKGDTVGLNCTREFVWASQSGWVCRWDKVGE